jgi:hypothetical protein
LARQAGGLVTLNLRARGISAPLDGFQAVIAFDPAVIEAFGVSDQTALGSCGQTRFDNAIVLCANNIANNANQAGILVFSVTATASPLPSPLVVSQDETLATFSFRALRRGTSSIDFHVISRPAPGATFSELFSATDPTAALIVAFEPDTPGLASIKVRRL